MSNTIHANAVFFAGKTFLLRGESGSGKSDLTFRMIENGGQLIADDRVIITKENNQIYLDAPDAIKGLIEIRGIGIIKTIYLSKMPLDILCDLRQNYERMPDERTCVFYDKRVDYYCLNPFELSILHKLTLIARNNEFYE